MTKHLPSITNTHIPVAVGVAVGVALIIVHTTWEGSGLQLSSSPHTEVGTDGVNPCC